MDIHRSRDRELTYHSTLIPGLAIDVLLQLLDGSEGGAVE